MSEIVIEQSSFLERSSRWDAEKIKTAYERLVPYIEEYRYLSEITNWWAIKDRPEIYIKLQEAYDIMVLNEIKQRWMRCKPCERMALCAIKDIVGNKDYVVLPSFKEEKEEWEIDELLSKLDLSEELKSECKAKEQKFLERFTKRWENSSAVTGVAH